RGGRVAHDEEGRANLQQGRIGWCGVGEAGELAVDRRARQDGERAAWRPSEAGAEIDLERGPVQVAGAAGHELVVVVAGDRVDVAAGAVEERPERGRAVEEGRPAVQDAGGGVADRPGIDNGPGPRRGAELTHRADATEGRGTDDNGAT